MYDLRRFAFFLLKGARRRSTMINVSSSNKPCVVEVALIWNGVGEYRPVAQYPSVRAARGDLAFAIYDAVDHLSRASYDIQLRLADGTIKPLSLAKQDHAIERCKAMRWDDSIGARLSRGETVLV